MVESTRSMSKKETIMYWDKLCKFMKKLLQRNLTTIQCFIHMSRFAALIYLNQDVFETRKNLQ